MPIVTSSSGQAQLLRLRAAPKHLETTSPLASTCAAAASASRPSSGSSIVHIALAFAREAPQAPAIFVAARLVNMPPIAGSQLFRCGVAVPPLR